ncbi:MAG: DUF2283 domain-containing protein [Bacteroidota bacterium]
MKITYDTTNDLLYIRFDTKEQTVTNVTVNDNIILDINQENKLIGIEILDASEMIALDQLFPIIKQPIILDEKFYQKIAG